MTAWQCSNWIESLGLLAGLRFRVSYGTIEHTLNWRVSFSPHMIIIVCPQEWQSYFKKNLCIFMVSKSIPTLLVFTQAKRSCPSGPGFSRKTHRTDMRVQTEFCQILVSPLPPVEQTVCGTYSLPNIRKFFKTAILILGMDICLQNILAMTAVKSSWMVSWKISLFLGSSLPLVWQWQWLEYVGHAVGNTWGQFDAL